MSEEETLPLRSMTAIDEIRGRIAVAAQFVYDAWQQDDEGFDIELGTGGICQDIADKICEVMVEGGFDTWAQCASNEQHVYCLAICAEGIVEVDIPYSRYERGAAYTWSKIPDVLFTADDVCVSVIDRNFENASLYREDDDTCMEP